jgi:hypothetical protein
MLKIAHQNFLQLVCYVLQRMGLDNCDKNVWAVALKDVITNKLKEEMLFLGEDDRNAIISKNNELLLKGIQSLQQQKDKESKHIFGAIQSVLAEIERVHINRVKEVLIKALNQLAVQ